MKLSRINIRLVNKEQVEMLQWSYKLLIITDTISLRQSRPKKKNRPKHFFTIINSLVTVGFCHRLQREQNNSVDLDRVLDAVLGRR